MTCFAAIGVAAVVGLSQSAAPQQPVAASGMEALLAEVRALRSELTQIAGASIRTQLLVARLQLQEQRINSISQQLTGVRAELAEIAQTRLAIGTQFKELEEAARREGVPPAEDRGPNPLKALLEGQQKRERELKEHEASLEALLAAEQSRWSEFNDQLDAVERELQLRSPR